MPKNIVVLSDGTGQNGGKGRDTNVYKLFRMLEDRTGNQVVFYDEGIGTEKNRISGSAFGVGFDKNILQCYRFIFDNYQSGDKIFLFGFSRGAATVRSLASFIHYFGILPTSRPELIEQAYKIYKNRQSSSDKQVGRPAGYNPLKILNHLIQRWHLVWRYDLDDEENGESAKFVRLHPNQWVQIEFLGVWDTVPALGLVVSDFWDSLLDLLPALRHNHHNFQLRKSVKHACHAISIDDQRKWFWPTVWKETQESSDRKKKIIEIMQLKRRIEHTSSSKLKFGAPVVPIEQLSKKLEAAIGRLRREVEGGLRQRVEQVWFGGSHTDVGGGFWEAGFSDISLEWMVQRAFEHGLKLYFGSRKYWNFCIAPDATDEFHDPRAGLGKIYAKGERSRIWENAIKTFGPPRIHRSVLERARYYFRESQMTGSNEERYDPWILKQHFKNEIGFLRTAVNPEMETLDQALEKDSEGLREWLNTHYDRWCLTQQYQAEYEHWLRETYMSESIRAYHAWCLDKTRRSKKEQDLPSLKKWMKQLDRNSYDTWKSKNRKKYTYGQWVQKDIEPLNCWVNDTEGREFLMERTRDVVYDPDGNVLMSWQMKEELDQVPENTKVFILRDYFNMYLPESPYHEYLPESDETYSMIRHRARRINLDALKRLRRVERKMRLRNPSEEDYIFRIEKDKERWNRIKEKFGIQ